MSSRVDSIGLDFISSQSIVEFGRYLRSNGISAGSSETVDALRAASVVAEADRKTLKFALRAVFSSSEEEWELFDALFDAFWAEDPPPSLRKTKLSQRRRFLPVGAGMGNQVGVAAGLAEDRAAEGEQNTHSGGSIFERLGRIDFSQMSDADLQKLERIASRLLRRMSYRIARKLRAGRKRQKVDLRRSIRRSIEQGGDPIHLHFRNPKRERANLVILLDVSDSMNVYSFFLLKFAYAMGRQSRGTRIFLFSTELVEATQLLRTRRISDGIRLLSKVNTGWAGGTRIGKSLQDFNRRYASSLLNRKTVTIILSDGWDAGPADELSAELRKIERRVARLIWLNPLLGLADYQPLTRGMSAALPYIDLFAPAHNLQSLLSIEKYLSPGRDV